MNPGVASLLVIMVGTALSVKRWTGEPARFNNKNRPEWVELARHTGLCMAGAVPVWLLSVALSPQFPEWAAALGLLLITGLAWGIITSGFILLALPDLWHRPVDYSPNPVKGNLPQGKLLVWDARKGAWQAIEVFDQEENKSGGSLAG